MVYGVVDYAVMSFVVVPLSAIGFSPPKSLELVWLSLAAHVFTFGLPISLVSRALLRRGSRGPTVIIQTRV